MASTHPERAVQTARVSLADAFSSEFVDILSAYAQLVVRAIESSDLLVFVARKALCLYYALQANGEVDARVTCAMTSSRALDCMDGLVPGTKVTIVDDVMVHGVSIDPFVRRIRELGGEPAIVVAGASNELAGNRVLVDADGDRGTVPLQLVRMLETAEVYRLSREMVNYVALSGVSNNVDQPLLSVPDSAQLLHEDPCWVDVTVNRGSSSVRQYTRNVDEDDLRALLPPSLPVEGVRAKLRLVVAGTHAMLVPFVLLPKIDLSDLKVIACDVLSTGAFGHPADTSKKGNRALYRTVHYALALRFAQAYLRLLGLSDFRLGVRHEQMLLGKAAEWLPDPGMVHDLPHEVLSAGHPSWELHERLPLAQGIVLMRLVALQAPGHVSGGDTRKVGITFLEIERALGGFYAGRLRESTLRSLASACVDVLVDKGFLVPILRWGTRQSQPTLERAYRGGEVFELTLRDLKQVGHMVRLLTEGDYALDVSHRGLATMDELAAIFVRWHAGQAQRNSQIAVPSGIERLSCWRLEYDAARRALSTEGVTVLDLAYNAGYVTYKVLDDGEWRVCATKALNTAKDGPSSACRKFATDMCRIERGLLTDGRDLSVEFSAFIDDLLVIHCQTFLVREISLCLVRLSAAIAALGEDGNAAGLDMVLEDLGQLVSSRNRDQSADELEMVAEVSGVATYDLEQYGGQGSTAAIDQRLFETIVQRARGICSNCASLLKDEKPGGGRARVELLVEAIEALAPLTRMVREGSDLLAVGALAHVAKRDENVFQAMALPPWKYMESIESYGIDVIERAARVANLHDCPVVCCPVWSLATFVLLDGDLSDCTAIDVDMRNVGPTGVRTLMRSLFEHVWEGPTIVCVFPVDHDCEISRMIEQANARLELELLDVGTRGDILALQDESPYGIRAYIVNHEIKEDAVGTTTNNFYGNVYGDIQPKNRIDARSSSGFSYRSEGQRIVYAEDCAIIMDGTGHELRRVGADADWQEKLDAFESICKERLGDEEYENMRVDVEQVRETGLAEVESVSKEERRSLLERIGAKAEAVNEIREFWCWIVSTIALVLKVVFGG